LSDQFCVDRHKKNFLDLVKNKIDIVFSNEQEILSLIDSQNFNDAITFAKNIKKNLIITRGNKGAISINKSGVFECSAKENLNIKDLTGAGDLFAAGYLHGVINNLSIEESIAKGTELSSKVIQKIGARI
jgi:sugar/nucleoside kinase (ribokinase family)